MHRIAETLWRQLLCLLASAKPPQQQGTARLTRQTCSEPVDM